MQEKIMIGGMYGGGMVGMGDSSGTQLTACNERA